MKRTAQAYAQFTNKTYVRTGSPWEGRFRSSVVQSDEYLMACHRYIELNPVRAKLVRKPGDYRWSSYRRNAFGECSPIVEPHEVYMQMGSSPCERQAAYRDLFGELADEPEFAHIRRAILGGFAVGLDGFAEQVGREAGRPAAPQKLGRPRKN
jgi:putative transposase